MCLFSKLFKTAVKHIVHIITIYYVPGLQSKNKCTRDRRIRTYIIATTRNLLYYYKLPLSDPKIKMPVYGDDQLYPSVVDSDSPPHSSICPQTNHTPDQFLLPFLVDRNTIGHDWRNNRDGDKYIHIYGSQKRKK